MEKTAEKDEQGHQWSGTWNPKKDLTEVSSNDTSFFTRSLPRHGLGKASRQYHSGPTFATRELSPFEGKDKNRHKSEPNTSPNKQMDTGELHLPGEPEDCP